MNRICGVCDSITSPLTKSKVLSSAHSWPRSYCSRISFDSILSFFPNGGFVTGGGWINSPAGAYIADATLTGKANFGFVSKYQKGATIPIGETEFQFQVAHLNFHSTVYEWLVVSGARAQYKGEGRILGDTRTFGFLLTAVDGQAVGGLGYDKFRQPLRLFVHFMKRHSGLINETYPIMSCEVRNRPTLSNLDVHLGTQRPSHDNMPDLRQPRDPPLVRHPRAEQPLGHPAERRPPPALVHTGDRPAQHQVLSDAGGARRPAAQPI